MALWLVAGCAAVKLPNVGQYRLDPPILDSEPLHQTQPLGLPARAGDEAAMVTQLVPLAEIVGIPAKDVAAVDGAAHDEGVALDTRRRRL